MVKVKKRGGSQEQRIEEILNTEIPLTRNSAKIRFHQAKKAREKKNPRFAKIDLEHQ